MMGPLTLGDRVAVVTGATGVVGGVVAGELAAAGARIVLAGRDRARLEAQAAALGLADGRWLAIDGELDADGAAELARRTVQHFGGADILVHLVGGYAGGAPLASTEPAELTTMLDQHVWTTFHLARAFAPALATGGWGRFVGVSSPFAFDPPGKNAAYAAAKAAQLSLILSLSRELRADGVTANALLVRSIDNDRVRLTAPSKSNARWTTPEEIAATIAWLCSDAAGQVTGTLVPLDGGPAIS